MEQNSLSKENLFSLLLDSSLISETNRVEYDMKIIQCGDYIQVYKFRRKKIKDNSLELLEEKKKKILDEDLIYKPENFSRKSEVGYIEYKNLIRSKNQLERLIKANKKEFKTFITLTIAENLKDIDEANKKLHSWLVYIRKLKSDFIYAGVPEFQKRGAVHYHLLTNLDISKDTNIIVPQKEFTEKALKKLTKEQRKHCYDVKGWSKGYVRVDDLKSIENVVTYLSKYLCLENNLLSYSFVIYFDK